MFVHSYIESIAVNFGATDLAALVSRYPIWGEKQTEVNKNIYQIKDNRIKYQGYFSLIIIK